MSVEDDMSLAQKGTLIDNNIRYKQVSDIRRTIELIKTEIYHLENFNYINVVKVFEEKIGDL